MNLLLFWSPSTIDEKEDQYLLLSAKKHKLIGLANEEIELFKKSLLTCSQYILL